MHAYLDEQFFDELDAELECDPLVEFL